MTKHWSRFDRQVRLLRASRRLLAEIRNLSDKVLLEQDRPRAPESQRLYDRASLLAKRIDRELTAK